MGDIFSVILCSQTPVYAANEVELSKLSLQDQAFERSNIVFSDVVNWRRHIHQYPELAYQEVNTAKYIAEQLKKMPGIEVHTGVGKTGIKAVLKGGKAGAVVALRADMDALPVEEKNDLPFRSQVKTQWKGNEVSVMHACGHDTHVAMLLGAAKVLSEMRQELSGTVVFIFQPAEEIGPGEELPGGAVSMVNDGVLESPKVDVVMGQHINATAPSGRISYKSGVFMASADVFHIDFKGKGGHGSYPWMSNTPMLAAAETVLGLQNIVSYRSDPTIDGGALVVTTGSMQSGNRFNILPDTAHISGTIRSLSTSNQKIAQQEIIKKAKGYASTYGVDVDVDISTGQGYGVLNNDPKATSIIIKALNAAAGEKQAVETLPTMASEDFGYYGESGVPVAYWHLNASPNHDVVGAPNHSPLFQIDESAMLIGVRALTAATLAQLEYLNTTKK